MERIAAAARITLQHGDLVPPNFLVAPNGAVQFFDWAEINAGSAAEELAAFVERCHFWDSELVLLMGTARSAEQGIYRRVSEAVVRQVLQRYHDALMQHGVEYPFPVLVDHFIVYMILNKLSCLQELRDCHVENDEAAKAVQKEIDSWAPLLSMLDGLC